MDEATRAQIDAMEAMIRQMKSAERASIPDPTSQPQWAPDSHYAREMRKWNAPRPPQEFPKMLMRATEYNGKWLTEMPAPLRYTYADDQAWLRAQEEQQRFDKTCQLTVANREEQDRAEKDGWRVGRAAALQYASEYMDRQAKAAAHRAYEDRGMSEGAKAEIEAADAATDQHLVEVPVARRSRPRKNAEA